MKQSTINNMILFTFALALVISSVAGFFHYGNLFYIALVGLVIFFFFLPLEQLRIGVPQIAFFLIACFLSLAANNVPSYFNAWNRFFVYSGVLVVVSPLFSGKTLETVRSKLLQYSLVTLSILSFGSFIAYFLGINLFIRNGSELEINAGTFAGLMNHSMVLGPFAAVSSLYLLINVLRAKKRVWKFTFLVLAIGCVMASLLAASRIATVALIVAVIILILRYYKGRISRALVVTLSVIAIVAATFPIWEGMTDFLIKKQESNIEQGGSVFYSRERKTKARLAEFKDSPLFGIGFCTVDPRYDVVDYSNGRVEPGTSWLAVCSMTGILGSIAFLSICFSAMSHAWKKEDKLLSCLYSSILVFFFVHMLAEGYIMAPRSYLNLFFWLLLGAIGSARVQSTR